MLKTSDRLIQEMTQKIVQAIEPRRIILFGSYARNTANALSDIDLLIVKDQPFPSGKRRREEIATIWRILASYPIEQDILLYSQEEIDRWKDSRNHVISHALREGRVLYERQK